MALPQIRARQTTLDDGIPLHEVTFCVIDLETTGGSPSQSAITEIGAVKMCGGERLGTFHTFVDPLRPIPRSITYLTGISDGDVAGSPPIDAVLPSLVEFLEHTVPVAHNARFDVAFLDAALVELDYPPLPAPTVCTARLARRIVWPDVPNVKLQTLAQYFRTSVRPKHRALEDAQATAEVLHGLLGLGARLGIATLGDLHEVVRARGRPNFGKIALAEHLPNGPGVYVFRGRDGAALYVGKSKDLRRRVRSYFYGDSRKKIEQLLSHVASVEGIVCSTELEALVVEARLIRRHEPRFNRRGKAWRRYAYLRIDPSEAWPRLKIARETTGPGVFLGPFSNRAQAVLAKEALEEAFPIRRCTKAMRATTRFAPCALADIGRCLAPCDGRVDHERYEELVRTLLSSLPSPGGLLRALEDRLGLLAAEERFEEAALARDRLRALAESLARARTDAWLVGSASLVLRDADGERIRLRHGALLAGSSTAGTDTGSDDEPLSLPCPRDRADELAAVRSWLRRSTVALVESAGEAPSEPVDGGAALDRLLGRLRAHDPRDSARS
ncbi:MAG: DEDD exonuclease domain-containing protein [Actinomycetota bacterium]